MKIRELMTSQAFICRPQDSLAEAAALLWQHDCGLLPVVDQEGRVGATITDRDICMGAMTRGRPLTELRVADSMSKDAITCKADEDLDAVVLRMCEHQLHRLPVVDQDGKVTGMLSLNDLATYGEHDPRVAGLAQKVLQTVCKHRTTVPAVEPKPRAAAAPKATAKQAAAGKA